MHMRYSFFIAGRGEEGAFSQNDRLPAYLNTSLNKASIIILMEK